MTTLQDQPRTQGTSFSPFGNQHAQEAEELHNRQQQQGNATRSDETDRQQSADTGETFTVSTDDWFK